MNRDRGKLLTAILALTLLGVASLGMPGAATPAGKVVVRGADSGSNLKLSVVRGRLVVEGRLARGHQAGCRVKRKRKKAVCRLRGVRSVDLRMGSSADFVRVLEKLPVALNAYLGGGSDKLIGNGERDTCFPGGARRNRCTLGGGNDTCITGNRNSDCVGGPGNDYCEHGRGSDGCWGGPGNDVCVMKAGQDGCHGERGNDRLYGGGNPDQLYGGPGRDWCDGGRGRGRSHACEAGPRR